MNSSFSFKRLLQLISKQWIENRRMYLMSVLALLGLLGIVFVFYLSGSGPSYDEDLMYVIGLLGLFITGAVFASTTFSMLGTKDKGIYWISFPASSLEKFLANLFFNVVVFTIVYVLIFFALKFICEGYIQYLISSDSQRYSYRKILWSSDKEITHVIPVFFTAFFAVQAAFILGSVAFKRFSFIITLVIVALLFFLFISYMSNLAKQGFQGYSFNLFSLKEFDSEKGVYKDYEISPLLKEPAIFFFKFLIAPFLWLITWFKLKEKQI